MTKPKLALLQAMPVFGGIKETVLQFILNLAPVRSVSKGEYFFRENTKSDSMFVMEEGHAAVLKHWQDEDYILYYLNDGNCFGEIEMINMCPRSVSILALEDCTAIEISINILHRLYQVDPKEFVMIHMNMGRELCRRLQKRDRELFEIKIINNIDDQSSILPVKLIKKMHN